MDEYIYLQLRKLEKRLKFTPANETAPPFFQWEDTLLLALFP